MFAEEVGSESAERYEMKLDCHIHWGQQRYKYFVVEIAEVL